VIVWILVGLRVFLFNRCFKQDGWSISSASTSATISLTIVIRAWEIPVHQLNRFVFGVAARVQQRIAMLELSFFGTISFGIDVVMIIHESRMGRR